MTDRLIDTLPMSACVERRRAGDVAAAEGLLWAISKRVGRVAHQMLRTFANVRGWANTADVIQGSLLRLIAELFGVHERTVRRRWQSACLRLNQVVGERLP